MTRPIDADALMRKTVELFYTTPYFNHISEMIERAPTIEIKEKALENLASAKTVTDPSRRVEMVCDLIRKKEG